jgi:hypothetical protein
VLAAPAVSRAKMHIASAHEHTGTVGASRHSLHNGFTAYAVLSPATNSSCHRHRRIKVLPNPVGPAKTSADLAPATGARTTRFCRTQPPVFAKRLRRALASFVWCALIAHGRTALRPQARPTLPRPPHPAPTFVTMANAPLRRTGRAAYSFDLPDGRSGIFLQPGLDRANHVDPAQEIRRLAHMLLVASNAVSGPIDAFSNDA